MAEESTDASLQPPLAIPSFRVDGRAFVITGGSQGLGKAVAELLRSLGAAHLVLVGRDRAKGTATAQQLSTPTCGVYFVQADLADASETQQVIPQALQVIRENVNTEDTKGASEEGIVITGLVNAAATTARGNLQTETAEGMDQQFAVNVRAPFLLTQALMRHLLQQDATSTGSRGASIVHVSSVAAHGGAPFLTAYSASKAALNNLTKTTAAELVKLRIRVNAVNMGERDLV